jgi:hypothetical protein
MKLFAPFTFLTASFFIVENASARLLGDEPQVVARVRVTGSDAGGCAFLGLPPDCDENYTLNANKFADGKVNGVLQDSFGDSDAKFHAKIDCLETKEANGYKVAILSGIETEKSIVPGRRLYSFAKIVSEGTDAEKGYYAFSFTCSGCNTCADPFLLEYDYSVNIFGRPWIQHLTGVLKIEIN